MTLETGSLHQANDTALPIPASSPTKVLTEIDFEADGKQVSHLRIPFSTDASAWGRILIPIVQFKNGDGPTVLLTGGVHGDEYEGPVILSKFIQRIRPAAVRGRIIIIPTLNLPAHYSATRTSPLDHKDLNRTFPGSRNGTISEVIAHYVQTILLPKSDVVVDIHSGGKSLDFVPSVVMHELPNRAQMEKTLSALKAFGAPYGLVLNELDGEGQLDTAAERMGKVFLSTELRGAGSVNPFAIQVGDNGIRNILKHFGVLDIRRSRFTSYSCKKTPEILTVPRETCFLSADEAGLYEPIKDLGDPLQPGDVLGQIHFVANLRRKPLVIKAAESGRLICRRVQGRVEIGDCVAVIGLPWTGIKAQNEGKTVEQ